MVQIFVFSYLFSLGVLFGICFWFFYPIVRSDSCIDDQSNENCDDDVSVCVFNKHLFSTKKKSQKK
jgi:hypothetical protein